MTVGPANTGLSRPDRMRLDLLILSSPATSCVQLSEIQAAVPIAFCRNLLVITL
ncbi:MULTISPECIES: hypothetical protein [unclassified Synechococcus]|uniref:hypothetical protein n=1 Tax=unclassified Synechococcus TaxID=2626047 RepID=UPI000AE279A6|nr:MULTISPECIES: hypothetical protein [unclassified Synechococcus]